MKHLVSLLSLGASLVVCAGQEQAGTPTADQAALAAEAATAAQGLGTALKAELEAALQTGGAVAALGVCRIKAPHIATRISAERGMHVSRTSLKPRNPHNAPDVWQAEVLREFESRKAAGEDPASLSYAAVVGNEFRFMQAIPTAPACLACHGERLAPDVSAKIAELYPQDQATGFRQGDLRGAFVIVKVLSIRP